MNRLSLYFIRRYKKAIIVYVDCRFISQFHVGEKKEANDNHLPIKNKHHLELFIFNSRAYCFEKSFSILYVDGFRNVYGCNTSE